jgi:hypothetical protein
MLQLGEIVKNIQLIAAKQDLHTDGMEKVFEILTNLPEIDLRRLQEGLKKSQRRPVPRSGINGVRVG